MQFVFLSQLIFLFLVLYSTLLRNDLIFIFIASISPDGRTLLSVGDSNKVYFHRISGGAQLTFTPITNLVIPPPDVIPLGFSSSSLVASFSTAFSRDGSKFAVASQEGVIAVWDVRSTKPIKVFHTDKSRGMRPMVGNGAASGWLSDDPWEWTRGTKAPGWCARNVKFNGGEGAKLGKEVMVFTEHTSVVHVVDALTFETHDIIRLPSILRRPSQFRRHLRQSSAPSIIISSSENNASSSTLSITAAQQRQTQRNLIRRVHPVSNTRRTPAPTPASGSASTATRRPANSMISRPDASRTPISSIRALVDAFRIPASAYSAPSSISDSTWRTLNDEMPVGPFVSSGTASSERMASTATSSPPLSTSPQMPALLALADFALDPISELRDLREDAPEGMREDEGALSRRIRREESALRGMRIERELFEDDGASGTIDSNVTEYAPSGSGTATGLGGAYRGRQRRLEGDAGIVVVPDLGDREMESEVHALLTRHGIRSRFSSHRRVNVENVERQGGDVVSLDDGSDDEYDEYGTEVDRDTNTGSTHGDYEYPLFESRRRIGVNRISRAPVENVVFDEAEEESMDVDDTERGEDSQDEIHPGEVHLDIEGEGEEVDCVSNSNSRSASPVLAFGSMVRSNTDTQMSATPTILQTSFEREGKLDDDEHDYGFGDAESREACYTGLGSSSTEQPDLAYYDDLDIAGICFDPWGERMYVAGMGTNVGDNSDRVFAGAFGGPGGSGVGNQMGTVVEWGVRGAEKRFWVDEGWM